MYVLHPSRTRSLGWPSLRGSTASVAADTVNGAAMKPLLQELVCCGVCVYICVR